MSQAIFAVLGVTLGAVIAGFMTWWSTKMQVDARREELSQELRHQQEEARRDRLVEARKGYLLPLREKSITYVNALESSSAAIFELEIALQTNSDNSEFERLWRKFESLVKSSSTGSGEFWNYLGQISDQALATLVSDLWESEESMRQELLSLAQSAYKLGLRVGGDDIDNESVTVEVRRLNLESKRIYRSRHEKLMAMNKRIEELLAGDDAT